MLSTVKPLPICFEIMPEHFWRRLRREALKKASSLGMPRGVWDAVREATLCRRDADEYLLVTGRVPEAGAFAEARALQRQWEAAGRPRPFYPTEAEPAQAAVAA